MKKVFIVLMTISILAFAISVHATLIDRGGGMIYSTDLNITWLQDANYAQTSGYVADGLMAWNEANTWATNLSYGGYHDWRLPTFDPINPDARTNPTLLHEMGYLTYAELGNPGNGGSDLDNTGPFINLLPDWYWSGTESLCDSDTAWRFDFECG